MWAKAHWGLQPSTGAERAAPLLGPGAARTGSRWEVLEGLLQEWPRRQTPTCLEDLVAHGEAGAVRLVVGHELDEQLSAAGDDGRRRDLATELAQLGGALLAAVVHLHVVVPAAEAGEGERRRRVGVPAATRQLA